MPAHRNSIFITGAASGIGRETALLFAERGWFVGLFDVNADALKALHKEIGKERSCFLLMDVTDEQNVESATRHFAAQTGGRMDLLFNNAGIVRMGPNAAIPLLQQKLILDINVGGILNCIWASMELLKNTKGSRIVNMSSASSLTGVPQLAVYAATKAAVGSLTESLNMEFEQYGIFVSDVRAPYVRTPLLDREVKAASIGRLGIHLTPQYVAKVVWKAAHSRTIHNDTKGILQLRLIMTLPAFIRRPIIKFLTM